MSNPVRAISNQVWIAYTNENIHALKQFAQNEETDFGVLNTKGKTIFHVIIDDNAARRLNAILEGFTEGQCVNRSIPIVINQEWDGKTPLYRVAESYYWRTELQKKIIHLFTLLGADCNRTFQGKTPIDIAPDGIKEVFNRNFYICMLNGEFKEALRCLRKIRGSSSEIEPHNILPQISNRSNNNYMLLAIQIGHEKRKSEDLILDILNILKDCGQNINHQNKERETVLGLALNWGYRKIISSLIMDPNLDWELIIPGGTIIHLAVHFGPKYLDVLKTLVTQKPESVHFRNRNNQTPLHLATYREAVDFLCNNGADVMAKDAQEHTPIQLAAVLNPMLADWMRLYDPNIEKSALEEIQKKYNKNQEFINKISEMTMNVIGTFRPAFQAVGEEAIKGVGAAMTASAITALTGAMTPKEKK